MTVRDIIEETVNDIEYLLTLSSLTNSPEEKAGFKLLFVDNIDRLLDIADIYGGEVI